MENSSLINALTIKYLNVYEIDIESRTAKIIKLEITTFVSLESSIHAF